MTHWFNAIVQEVKPLTANTREFLLNVPDVETFSFLPGQFVTLDLPIGEKRRDRWRSYSIASAPDGSNQFSLCIVRNPAGAGTRYLFDEIKAGSQLRCKGPDGSFTLPPLPGRQLIFVCTGTGIAPFRSMLRAIQNQSLSFEYIHLIFGTRTKEDILYEDEWVQLEKDQPQFHWDVALSREKTAGYHAGYVHGVIEDKYSIPNSQRHFYLCGWAPMVDEASGRLQAMGYSPSQIHIELYG